MYINLILDYWYNFYFKVETSKSFACNQSFYNMVARTSLSHPSLGGPCIKIFIYRTHNACLSSLNFLHNFLCLKH